MELFTEEMANPTEHSDEIQTKPDNDEVERNKTLKTSSEDCKDACSNALSLQ